MTGRLQAVTLARLCSPDPARYEQVQVVGDEREAVVDAECQVLSVVTERDNNRRRAVCSGAGSGAGSGVMAVGIV